MFRFFFKQERCKDEKLQSKYACADQPSAPGCRTDGAINRCMGSVSATSGPDTELQVPDEILQKIGMKTSFSKDVPKLSILFLVLFWCPYMTVCSIRPSFMGIVFGVYRNWIWEFGDLRSYTPILWGSIWPNTIISIYIFFFPRLRRIWDPNTMDSR